MNLKVEFKLPEKCYFSNQVRVQVADKCSCLQLALNRLLYEQQNCHAGRYTYPLDHLLRPTSPWRHRGSQVSLPRDGLVPRAGVSPVEHMKVSSRAAGVFVLSPPYSVL